MENENNSILLVDDDKSILRSLMSFLQGYGYSVDTAETGKEAIEKIQTRQYVAAVFDVTLPDISGTELLLKIPKKASQMLKIVMSGLSTREVGFLAADNGADEYLVKPINPLELLKLIREPIFLSR